MDFIDRFYEAFSRAFGPHMCVYLDALPREMLVGEPGADGWIEWRPLRRPGRVLDFGALESACGRALPRAFKDWMSRYDALELDCGLARLTEIVPPEPLQPLLDLVTHPGLDRVRDLDLIPIGYEALMDAGPICLDASAEAPDADWPVVFHDPGWIGTDAEVVPLASSFEAFLLCLTRGMTDRQATADDFRLIDPKMPDAAHAYWSRVLRSAGRDES